MCEKFLYFVYIDPLTFFGESTSAGEVFGGTKPTEGNREGGKDTMGLRADDINGSWKERFCRQSDGRDFVMKSRRR